jgi:hypothetical protein
MRPPRSSDRGGSLCSSPTIVPKYVQRLIDQASAVFPRIRITDLLMEVDSWTGFTNHFTCLKTRALDVGTADRRHHQDQNHGPALGRNPTTRHVHQDRYCDSLPHDAETPRLPPTERTRPRTAGAGLTGQTLFRLDWLQDQTSGWKVTAGLNKGEARNTLAREVFFNRLGEIRDRSFEQQRYRANGLDLLTAAIVLWNTVYPDRTIATSTNGGNGPDPELRRFLSPLGWEYINLTGDYTRPRANQIKPGNYRPSRCTAKR